MNFNISLSDELSEKIILKAAENNITPTHYIEMLINSIIIDNPNAYFDYISAANIITEQAEALAKENSVGKTFPLNDLPYFKELNNTIDLNGRTAPSTVKARIGRNFNKAVANDAVKNIKRAQTPNGELRFLHGAALYEVTSG
mgnify:FL=1